MRKFFSYIICLFLIFLLCGCEASDMPDDKPEETSKEAGTTEVTDSSDELYREHQELTGTEADFDENEILRVSLLDVGLENVIIKSVCQGELDSDFFGTVCLLADDRYGGSSIPADHYLAIVSKDKLIVKDTSAWKDQACYSGYIELHDFDGDSDNEIVLQEIVGMTGGAGSYLSRVFDFKDGEIIEIFSSLDSEENYGNIDTGFSIKLLDNHRFEINNSITGYSETFQAKQKSEEYFKWWYTDKGELKKDTTIMVDSFAEFVPVDIDGDYVYEIKCKQYVSLIGHSDGIGWANTVLKYNIELECFEIVEASFEPFR